MKQLFEEERKAYNEDRAKYEMDCEKVKTMAETKIKIVRAKLISLYDGNIERAQDLTIEEILDHIAFRLNS